MPTSLDFPLLDKPSSIENKIPAKIISNYENLIRLIVEMDNKELVKIEQVNEHLKKTNFLVLSEIISQIIEIKK